jgi:hypothetical protein
MILMEFQFMGTKGLIGIKIFKLIIMYYKVWADCICRVRMKGGGQSKWIFDSVLIMSFFMSLNLFVVIIVFQKSIGYFFYEIKVETFSGFLNYILTVLLLYFLPVYFINFIFVRKNIDRLLHMINEERLTGSLILRYSLFSILFPLVLFWFFWLY